MRAETQRSPVVAPGSDPQVALTRTQTALQWVNESEGAETALFLDELSRFPGRGTSYARRESDRFEACR